jgi:predicted DNA-binding transcriptional regulator YafY
VRAVTCVIRSDDTTLLTEIAAAHALRGLDLTRLAPTVLASGAPVTRTLAALRQAGYAPLSEDDSGAVVVEKKAAPRIETPVAARGIVHAPRSGRAAKSTVDPTALARKLLAVRPKERQLTLVPPPRGGEADDPFTQIARRAPHLSDRAVKLLASAVEHGTPVRIDYTDGHGRISSRVIEDVMLNEHLIEAWCRLREDERAFHLDRIDAVYPV